MMFLTPNLLKFCNATIFILKHRNNGNSLTWTVQVVFNIDTLATKFWNTPDNDLKAVSPKIIIYVNIIFIGYSKIYAECWTPA